MMIFSIIFISIYLFVACTIDKIKSNEVIIKLLFIIYILGIIYITVISRKQAELLRVELIPFRAERYFMKDLVVTVDSYIQYGKYGKAILWNKDTIWEAIMNVLLFVPFGISLQSVYKQTLKKTMLFALFFSFSIEIVQLVSFRGCFEIDDIKNNVLGSLMGLLLIKTVKRRMLKE